MTKNINKFSVILPVINETFSLEKTIEIIITENSNYIKEIIIITSKSKTLDKSFISIENIKSKYPNIIFQYNQDLPFIGGAIQKGFEMCSGSHVIMMASDLETDPSDVKNLIAKSIVSPESIITASRWKKTNSFKNYNLIKLVLNFIFQNIMKVLFFSNLSDMTYGYRLFPSKIVKKMNCKELKHPFLLETILNALKLNIKVIEISSDWKARTEGASQNKFMANFLYLKTAIRIRFFLDKNSILK